MQSLSLLLHGVVSQSRFQSCSRACWCEGTVWQGNHDVPAATCGLNQTEFAAAACEGPANPKRFINEQASIVQAPRRNVPFQALDARGNVSQLFNHRLSCTRRSMSAALAKGASALLREADIAGNVEGASCQCQKPICN